MSCQHNDCGHSPTWPQKISNHSTPKNWWRSRWLTPLLCATNFSPLHDSKIFFENSENFLCKFLYFTNYFLCKIHIQFCVIFQFQKNPLFPYIYIWVLFFLLFHWIIQMKKFFLYIFFYFLVYIHIYTFYIFSMHNGF